MGQVGTALQEFGPRRIPKPHQATPPSFDFDSGLKKEHRTKRLRSTNIILIKRSQSDTYLKFKGVNVRPTAHRGQAVPSGVAQINIDVESAPRHPCRFSMRLVSLHATLVSTHGNLCVLAYVCVSATFLVSQLRCGTFLKMMGNGMPCSSVLNSKCLGIQCQRASYACLYLNTDDAQKL